MLEERLDPEAVIEEFELLSREAGRVQRETLQRILDENGRTEYLQRFGLNGRTDPDSFKACVPIVTHSDLEPYIQRVAHGSSPSALTGKPITTISFSSGTTQGKPKFVPFNDELMESTMQIYKTSFSFRNRKSDSSALKTQLKCRGQRSFCSSRATRVGFVIFVVNGLTVLESMNSSDEKKKECIQIIAANFNNPLLSFKDDKPAIVITHGDLLPLSDRVRVRTYLGELLGIPPTGQIFDIPENNDPATKLTIFDMVIYCLERAHINLPAKEMISDKVFFIACLILFFIIAVMAVVLGFPSLHRSQPPPLFKVDWTFVVGIGFSFSDIEILSTEG